MLGHPGRGQDILLLLAMKVLIGTVAGYLIDFLIPKRHDHKADMSASVRIAAVTTTIMITVMHMVMEGFSVRQFIIRYGSLCIFSFLRGF